MQSCVLFSKKYCGNIDGDMIYYQREKGFRKKNIDRIKERTGN